MDAIKMLARSFAMAFTCFSRIPMPRVDWCPRNLRFMMAAFPLVGAVIGAAVFLWALLAQQAQLGVLLTAAGIILVPLGISGAIHMDGFCDVVDALSSHAEPARKREILKDPHSGAFASICGASYLILSVAVASELSLTSRATPVLATLFVLSRCVSAFCVLAVPRSTETGMLASFQVAADKKPAIILVALEALACWGLVCWISWETALVLLVVALAVTVYVVRMARREFGGWSGDSAGFLLQTLELAFLVEPVGLTEKVVPRS